MGEKIKRSTRIWALGVMGQNSVLKYYKWQLRREMCMCISAEWAVFIIFILWNDTRKKYSFHCKRMEEMRSLNKLRLLHCVICCQIFIQLKLNPRCTLYKEALYYWVLLLWIVLMESKLWVEQELLFSTETDCTISEIYGENFLSMGKIENTLKLGQIFNWRCRFSFVAEINQNSVVNVNWNVSEFIVICSELGAFYTQ